MNALRSEASIYGMILVSGLLVIVSNSPGTAAHEALIKVMATVGVFWLAHVYSATVAHLGDQHRDTDATIRIPRAIGHAMNDSWGMLIAALVPLFVLGLGVLGLITAELAIWVTLWLDVLILGVLGYLGVASWHQKQWVRLLGALTTAALGVGLIILKALIH